MAEAFVLVAGGSVDRPAPDLGRHATVLGFDRLKGPYAGMIHVRGSTAAIRLLATAVGAEPSEICWVHDPVHEGTERTI